MFKCKECGCEYELKPDFCDCGNDEFEEFGITENKTTEEPAKKVINNEPKPAQEFVKEIKKEQIHKQEKKSFKEQYPEIERFKSSLDPVSLIIFTICIILSFVVIFFAWNPAEQTSEKTETKQETITNIPPIDKFWNNALPKVIEPEKKPEPKKEIVEKVIPVIKPVQQQVVKQQPAKIPAIKQAAPKTTTIKLTKTTNTKTVAQSKAQEKAKLEAEKAKQDAEAKAKKEAELKAKQDAEAKARQSAAAKQELSAYKTNLRNTIGYKIDFTKVVGDGSCVVAFKISPSGQLTNRSFAQQSTNITLNDAVYKAIMATPKFTPPPSGYNNETLNLHIRFYNGNFEITLK